ncbi:hypothetical protein ACFPC0_33220 [Streptomyces andamanensis]|uniref:Uncharacterized protein n=1 Tax=Streptomyces andamanensis TaxID=1565035 RepID=A0ABV8TPX6_9ACTN
MLNHPVRGRRPLRVFAECPVSSRRVDEEESETRTTRATCRTEVLDELCVDGAVRGPARSLSADSPGSPDAVRSRGQPRVIRSTEKAVRLGGTARCRGHGGGRAPGRGRGTPRLAAGRTRTAQSRQAGDLAASRPGTMGAVSDALIALLEPGGVATVFAGAVIAWVQTRRGNHTITVTRPDGTEITISSGRTRDVSPQEGATSRSAWPPRRQRSRRPTPARREGLTW